MIFAFTGKYDNSARNVIDWIRSIDAKTEILIIDETIKLYPLNIELNNISNSEQIANLYTDKISFYYYRRGKFRSYLGNNFDNFNEDSKEWFQKEEDTLFEYIETKLLLKNYYGSINKEKGTNKLINLHLAKQCGINIPRTLVTATKEILERFNFENKNGTIVKPIRNHKLLKTRNGINYIPMGTKVITSKMIEQLNKEFFPCLFQEYITKKYEIRVFFFEKKIFSMAIFSQKNSKTQIDFRNYDSELPNRCVPYMLPKDMEEKVLNFVQLAQYDTGSIDLLLGRDGKYYFLEINHSGHYEWLSENCNYYIDKVIAECIYEKSKS